MMDKENEQWCASSLSISKPRSQELMKKAGDVSLSMTKRTADRASNITVRPLGMSARVSNNPSVPLRQARTTSKQDGLSTPIQGSSQGAQRVLLGNHSDIYLSLWDHSSKEGGATPLLASPLSCDLVNSTAIGPGIQHRESDNSGSGLAKDAARVDTTNAALSKATPRVHQMGQGGTFRKSSETRSPRAAVPGAVPPKAEQVAPKPPKTPLPSSTTVVGSGGVARGEYVHILKWEPALRPASSRREPTRKEASGVPSGRMAHIGDATPTMNTARSQQQLASSTTDPSPSATEKRVEGSRRHANKSPSRSRIDANQVPAPITGRAPRDSDSGRRHTSKKEEDTSPLASDRAPSPASSTARGRGSEDGAMGSGVQGRSVSTRTTKTPSIANTRKPKGSYGVSAELGALRVKVSTSGGLSKSMIHDSDSDEEDTSPLELQTSSGATIRRSSADSPIKRTPSVTKRSPNRSTSSPSSSTEPATTSTEREGNSPARAHRKGGRTSAGTVPGSAAVERLLERSSIAESDGDEGRGSSRTAAAAAATARKKLSADQAGAEDRGGDTGYGDGDSSDDMSITDAVVIPRRVSRHPGGAPGVSKKPGKASMGPAAPPVVPVTPVTPAANGGKPRATETREARASAARSASRPVAAVSSAARRGEERPEKSSGDASLESSRSNRAGSGIASAAAIAMKPAAPGSALAPAGVEPSESKRNGAGGGVDSSRRVLGSVAVGGNPGGKTAGPSQEACAGGMPSGSFGSFETVVVQGKQYLKTIKIGRGGSSEVFRVLSSDGQMLALKTVKVDVRGEHAEVLLSGYANEIELLKSLQGSPYIIHLENAEVDRGRGVINIVLELGETDLSRVIKQAHSGDGSQTTRASRANFMRHLWDQMLRGVHAMHEDRVVHGDLKPANFVFVRTRLKLIDFGIAKAISNDTTNISRDSQVGTLNYMSPEAFKDTGKGGIDPVTGKAKPMIKLGRASDIWSLGCMLYQMTFGQPPFSHLGIVQKVHAITNPDYVITFPSTDDEALLDTLRSCLERAPQKRPSIAGAGGLLSHRYLNPAIKDSSAEAAAVEARLSTIRRMESAIAAKVHEIKRRERDLESRVAAEVKSRMAATVGRQ